MRRGARGAGVSDAAALSAARGGDGVGRAPRCRRRIATARHAPHLCRGALPARRAFAAPRAETGPAVLRPRVLLVEDNLVNQEVAKEYFWELGCEVAVAANGAEAVRAVQAQAFDIVFMDCLMPEMDGFQATRAIRDRERREGGLQILIIALTANAFASDREKCLAAGMSDYLSKPFTADDIERQLRNGCRTAAARAARRRDRRQRFAAALARLRDRNPPSGCGTRSPSCRTSSRTRATAAQPLTAKAHMTETRPTRILVIDDEITQRMLVKEYLEEAGYQVRLSESGEHGLKLANAVAPDLIIVDALLPSLDGYTVCATIRERPKTADIPVILMTGLKRRTPSPRDRPVPPISSRSRSSGGSWPTALPTCSKRARACAAARGEILRRAGTAADAREGGAAAPYRIRIERAKVPGASESQDVRAKAEEQIGKAQAAADAAIEASKAAHAEEIRAVRTAAAAEIQAAREAAAQEARSLWSFVATINADSYSLVRSCTARRRWAARRAGLPELREHLTVLQHQAKSPITLAHNVNIFAQSLSAKAPSSRPSSIPRFRSASSWRGWAPLCRTRARDAGHRRAGLPAPLRRRAEGRVRSAQRDLERHPFHARRRHLELRRQAPVRWLARGLVERQRAGDAAGVVERLRNCLEHPGEIAGIHGGPIGLGLPTAMSIARLHGGRLEFASSVGQGRRCRC